MKVYAITDKDKLQECREYLKATDPTLRNLVLFELSLKTLLRISDVRTLRVGDVYKKTTIRLKQKKTKKYVEIPIRKDLKKLLDKYCEGKPSYEYLLKSRKGYNQPIKENQCWRILKDMNNYLGLNNYGGIGVHSLRKTGAYFMFKETNDIDFIRRMLGHRSNQEVYAYIYSGLKSDRELINKAKF